MALSAGSVSLGVKSDTRGFGKKLASDISKEASSSGLSGIGKAIGGTLVAGIATAVAGVGAMVAVGIGEVMDASAGTAQLAAGIKSTGNAANVSVKGMNDLASSIQDLSGQTDDSIVKAEGLLLTFTNIKNVGPDKIFDDATRAAANMAAKLGGDAASQSMLLGKALNDPVKGVAALTRVGVSFTEGQKKSIEAMVKTGDAVGAQKLILGELNKEFGGAAKAAGESLPGQLARGRRAFEDLSQNVVSTFLPLVLPAITKVTGVLKDMMPAIQDGAVVVRDWLVAAWKDFSPIATTVWGILKGFGAWLLSTLVPAVAAFGRWIRDNGKLLLGLALVVGSMIVAFKTYVAIMGVVRIATIAWTVVQGILNGTLIANPIGLIVMAIAGLVAGIIWVATQTTFFQDVWSAMCKFVQDAIAVVVGWVSQNWGLLLSLMIGPLGLVIQWVVEHWSGIVLFFQTALGAIGGFFSSVFGGIGGIIRGAFTGVVDFVRGIFNNIIGVVNGIIDGINTATGKAGAVGIKIGKIPHLPKLAESGTVLPRPGGTLVVAGEGGKAESVVDTGKLNKLMDAAANGRRSSSLPESITLVDADGSIMARTHVIARQETTRTLNQTLRGLA